MLPQWMRAKLFLIHPSLTLIHCNQPPNTNPEDDNQRECSDDKEKFIISKKADEYFTANYDCITIDGVRIKFDDGWGLVRASNTQPVIVCRFEAKSVDRMQEIQNEVLNKLSEFGEISLEYS